MEFLNKTFKLKENKTDVKTELIAGLTTFMTMAYILVVNPNILSEAGMDRGAVFTATALSAALGTLLMALFANYPFVLAPGMGLNAYFTYTVVGNMGYSWQVALTAVFFEGIIFILLSLTKVRESVFNAIPTTLKNAVSVGIGFYIAFIGLQKSGIVVNSDSTLVSIYSLKNSFSNGQFSTSGITFVLAIVGIMLTAILMVRKVKGNILIGILGTWLLGVLCEVIGIYQPDGTNFVSLIPDFSNGISIPSIAPVFCELEFSNIFSLDFFVVIIAFLFVDFFDTLGTVMGVASKADMLDEDGKLPHIKGALLADAVGTTVGAVMGTSTVTTFVESSSGVAEGGRTGLTAITSALLFLVALILYPIFMAIPSFATAPALIMVGFLMITNITKIDFSDVTEGIPAFITIMAMPFTYSISEGIALGSIFYVVVKLFGKKGKSVSPIMYVLAALFVLKYIII